MTYRTKLPYLFIPAILALAAPAFSQDATECASHADCAEGYTCEKGMYVNGCDPDAGSCDSEVHEAEFGTCQKEPVTCETDEDCGEYLSCQSSESGDCWASSDGSSGCSEPDPDAAKYCTPAYAECEVDEDCPRSFECAPQETCAVIDIDCPEGEECDVPACEPSGGSCMPKQIDCDADADCPSEWSCVTRIEYSCTGGGTSPGIEPDMDSADDPGSAEEGDGVDGEAADAAEPAPDEDCTEVESAGFCEPDAWEGTYYGSEDATNGSEESPRPDGGDAVVGGEGDDDGSEESPSGASSDPESSSDAGGCSVTPSRTGTPGPLGLLLLLAAPFVFFRRRLTGVAE